MTLEPIDPGSALRMYLADKSNDLSEASIEAHRIRLSMFVRWCNDRGMENLNELSGRKLHEFRLARREEGNLNKVSEKTQMDAVRVFVRWLETIDGVEPDLSEKVLSPDITPEENSRDVMLESDRASAVLTHLEKYEYASREHVTISLLWHTMMRTGGVRALDVEDYHPEERYMEVRHRAETGTPVKNKESGERLVALSDQVCALLDDWIAVRRPVVTDDHGRNPLLSTRQGRISKSTIRKYVNNFTRPCVVGQDCPHDREISECEATQADHDASKCPLSVNPHAIRRGSITHSLTRDMPDKVVSDRANVSQAVIDQHYDRRTEREKMEQRRELLDNL